MQLQHKDCSLKKYLFFEIFLLLRNHTCVKCHIQLSRRIAFLSFQFIDSALLECCLLHSGARCLPGFLWISVSCYCFKSLKKKNNIPPSFSTCLFGSLWSLRLTVFQLVFVEKNRLCLKHFVAFFVLMSSVLTIEDVLCSAESAEQEDKPSWLSAVSRTCSWIQSIWIQKSKNNCKSNSVLKSTKAVVYAWFINVELWPEAFLGDDSMLMLQQFNKT